MTDWRDIPIPERMQTRPLDGRGFPVTFVTLMVDGRPDFTTIDAARIIDCIQDVLCAMCGTTLYDLDRDFDGQKVAFIGGPLSIGHRNFLDPGMHEECAAYAMQVCPHIVHDTSRYKKQDLNDGVRSAIERASDERPERFGMLVADIEDLGLTRTPEGQPVFQVDPAAEVEVRWQNEPQYDADGEELMPYFETRYYRLEAHQEPHDDDCACHESTAGATMCEQFSEQCGLDTTIVTSGRHRKGSEDKLVAMLCIGCNVLHKLERVTDPAEIDKIRNPSEEDFT